MLYADESECSSVQVQEILTSDYDLDNMAWAKPQHNRGRINDAGRILIKESLDDEWMAAVEVISNWRSCHGYPLQVLKMTLKNRAQAVDPSALVAQRLKRLSSIVTKLKRFEHMDLSQMQDLGGCRAVVSNVKKLHSLVRVYYSK